MENKIESIRCIKCNSIMVLQRSSDTDFVLHSSRYHYKCSKTKCTNYCVKIFSPSITRSHEMNKQLIGTKYHIQLPVGDEHTMTTSTGAEFDDNYGYEYNKDGTFKTDEFDDNDKLAAMSENGEDERMETTPKTILRFNEPVERVKLEIEFDINAIVRLTQDDIKLALNEMFEQIDLQESTINSNNEVETNQTQINNFKCQVWKQSL